MGEPTSQLCAYSPTLDNLGLLDRRPTAPQNADYSARRASTGLIGAARCIDMTPFALLYLSYFVYGADLPKGQFFLMLPARTQGLLELEPIYVGDAARPLEDKV